jgi:2-keto-4-pentenoate hydratase/2-oxohepta-3-ene-1,7-dioic acid hydratase in catechol pathway
MAATGPVTGQKRAMKLATYGFDDGVRVGIIEGDLIADPGLAEPLAQLLDPQGLARIAAAAKTASRQPLLLAKLLAPIPQPPLFLGIGLNYRDHAREVGRELGDTPAVFAKPANSVAAPFGTISSEFASFDYEGELGVVIGRRCHRVTAADAAAFIAGYVVVNDLSVRELLRPDTLVLGKGGFGHAPFGPWLTTAEDVPDPHDLAITTHVNGDVRQQSNTRELHRNVFEIIAWLSSALVLEPGTVIATGSPAGSGAGFSPPRWLVPGDVVSVEIERLGCIEHRVVAA